MTTAAQSSAPVGAVHPKYRPPRRHLPRADRRRWIDPDNRKGYEARAEAMRLAQIRTAQRDPSAFFEYCFRDERTWEPLETQWYQEEWNAALDNGTRVVIIAPRNHGKTTFLVARTIWELGRNPDLRIKIVCASDPKARERLWEITQHLRTNPRVREVFPHLEPAEDAEWSKHQITVKRTARHRDASVQALGILSTVTGARTDLLIADDVVDQRNAILMPALRSAVKSSWLNDWSLTLEPDARVWYLATPWHRDDLTANLQTNQAYTVIRYAVGGDFGSMWPTKWPEDRLRSLLKELGSASFARAMHCEVTDEGTALVREDWIHYADLEHEPEFADRLDRMAFITSYDPAIGTSSEHDWSASVAIAVDPERRRVWVVDGWHMHETIGKQSDVVAEEARRYQPVKILIEKVGLSTLDEWVLNKYPELAGLVQVTTPRVSKAARLAGVTPLLESGVVVFSDHLNPASPTFDHERGNLVGELIDFPFAKHDDLADAWGQAMHGARRLFLDNWAPGVDNEAPVIELRIGGHPIDDGHPF